MNMQLSEHGTSLFSVQGKWKGASTWNTLVDPLNGEPFIKVAEVDETGIQVWPFGKSVTDCIDFIIQTTICFLKI